MTATPFSKMLPTSGLDNSRSEYRRALILRLLIVAVVLLTFGEVCWHYFILMDDPIDLYSNVRLMPPSLPNIAHFWRHAEDGLYIPITFTAWSGLAAISHTYVNGAFILSPWGFHAAPLLLHVVAALLVFEILRRLMQQTIAAALGALLFAIHPLQAEPVAWAMGLKDVLSGVLGLLAIWEYMLCVASKRPSRARIHWAMASIAFAAAVLAKPAAVAIVAMVGVLDVLVLKQPIRRSVLRLMPWALFAIILVLVTRSVQPMPPLIEYDAPLFRPLIALDAIGFYLWKLLWPFSLSAVYVRSPADVITGYWFVWTVPALLILAWILWDTRRKTRFVSCAAAVFVAALLPVLGFIPFTFQRYSTVADRYVYLAMLGPAMALTWWIGNGGRIRIVIASVLLALLAFRSFDQQKYWSTDLILFEHAVAISPQAPLAHLNYGGGLAMAGRDAQAAVEFTRTIELNPYDMQAHGALNLMIKQINEAKKSHEIGTQPLGTQPQP